MLDFMQLTRTSFLQEGADILQRLRDEFQEEYKIYDLWTLSIALVFPLVRRG